MTDPHPRLTLSWRIWTPIWRHADTFAALVDWLTAHPRAVDEIALFSDFIHVPGKPIEQVRDDASLLAERMAALREAGVASVGINVLGTMGHGIHRGARPMPFEPNITPEGGPGKGLCPSDPAFRRYVSQLYTAMAEARPAFIWVDDDVRMTVGECLCERCLAGSGMGLDRPALVAALNSPEGGEVRRRWSEYLADTLVALCDEIRRAIDAVDPAIETGLMVVGYSIQTHGQYDIGRMIEALRTSRVRPGCGYYNDDAPRQLLTKVVDVGRLVRDCPPRVANIQYELENWPYITLDKAVATVIHECTASLMMGCNGVAFNALSECATQFIEYDPLAEAVEAQRPVWQGLLDAADGLPIVGFWPADHPERMARREVKEGEGWALRGGPYDINTALQLGEMGIPLTPDSAGACGTLLTGRIAEAFSDEELRAMLAGAVYLDPDALEVLWSRGLGELTGVRPGAMVEHCFERQTAHALNGPDAGAGRRVMHYADVGRPLEPMADDVADLAHLVREVDESDAGCCLSLFENPLGGRVAVSSYSPWIRLGRSAKRRQLQAVFDWLARGRMPVRIDATVRVWPVLRSDPSTGRSVLMLLNTALDATGPLAVRLLGEARRAWRLTPAGPEPLSVRSDGPFARIDLPALAAWECAVVVTEGA